MYLNSFGLKKKKKSKIEWNTDPIVWGLEFIGRGLSNICNFQLKIDISQFLLFSWFDFRPIVKHVDKTTVLKPKT